MAEWDGNKREMPAAGAGAMSGSFEDDTARFETMLRVGESFDVIRRPLHLAAGARSVMYYIDGFVKDGVMQRLMQFFITEKTLDTLDRSLPYVEVDRTASYDRMLYALLSGAAVYLVEGRREAFILDTRTYPTRSVEEPDNDKVMRGARDGFTETLVFNTALVRRRIRDPALTMSLHTVGHTTRTDVVVCYLRGRANGAFVKSIEKKLDSIRIDGLNMGQESLAECLIHSRWYDPFPKIRYTERPDMAAAHLLEGGVLIFCDNTPSVMVLPTGLFDFTQETDDYYFPPLTGSYLRFIRLGSYLVTLLLVPLWYLFMQNPGWIPPWLDVIRIRSAEPQVSLLVQILMVEAAVDVLKLASANTPGMMGTSLSVVAGLILGDFAVSTGWLVPDVIFYMSVTLITNFAQASYEMGYALKFMRILILLLTAAAGLWGFAAGIVLTLLFAALNRTVDGSRSYLYPLIPYNGSAMKRLLLRVRLRRGGKGA